MIRKYYEVLQVSEDATPEQIERAYKRAASRTHPDKNIGHEGEAAEEFKRVKEAYECLIDPDRREAYDRNGDTGVDLGDPVSEFFIHIFNEIIDQFETVDGLLKRMNSVVRDLLVEIHNKKKEIQGMVDSTNRMMSKVQYGGKDMDLVQGLLQDRLRGLENSRQELERAEISALGVQKKLKDYKALDRETPKDPHQELASRIHRSREELWRSLGGGFKPFT